MPLHAGSRGLVFQTGSPFRARIRGLKTPAIERPSCGRGCIGMQSHAGFACQRKEAMAGIRAVSRRWLCKARGDGVCEGYAGHRSIESRHLLVYRR